jgi:hypothetical protein
MLHIVYSSHMMHCMLNDVLIAIMNQLHVTYADYWWYMQRRLLVLNGAKLFTAWREAPIPKIQSLVKEKFETV